MPMGNKNVIHLHDIVHCIDNLLKKELANDETWSVLTKQMTNTTQKLKLSSLSHFIPPRQRQKQRMLGEIMIVKWARIVLRYLDRGIATAEETAKLGWLQDYRTALLEYWQISLICKMSIEVVRKKGYYKGVSEVVEKRIRSMMLTERAKQFVDKVIRVLKEEEDKIPDEKCYPGSSEVIESLFGKFKQLEKNHSSDGLTSLVLSMPAMLGKMSIDCVKDALEMVSVKKAQEWVENNIGISFWSKRRECFSNNNGSKNTCKDDFYLDMDEFIEYAS